MSGLLLVSYYSNSLLLYAKLGLHMLFLSISVAYSIGSELRFRPHVVESGQTKVEWRTKVAQIWVLHFGWGLGLPLLLQWFYFQLFDSSFKTTENPSRWCSIEVETALVLLFAVVLNAGATLIRSSTFLEFPNTDSSSVTYSHEVRIPGMENPLHKKKTSVLNTPSTNDTRSPAPSSPVNAHAFSNALKRGSPIVTTGPYALARHPGFTAHTLQIIANAVWIVVLNSNANAVSVLESLMFVVSLTAWLATMIFKTSAVAEEKELLNQKSTSSAYRMYRQTTTFQFNCLGLLWQQDLGASRLGDIVQVLCFGENADPILDVFMRANEILFPNVIGYLSNFATKVREGSSRQFFLWVCGKLWGQHIEYLDVDQVVDRNLLEKVLSSPDKGRFIEEKIACPAWDPIQSLESLHHSKSMPMRAKLSVILDKLDRSDTTIQRAVEIGIVAELERVGLVKRIKDIKNGESPLIGIRTYPESNGIFDSSCLCGATFRTFMWLVTRLDCTDEEISLVCDATEEWKATIAFKQPPKTKETSLKERYLEMIRRKLVESNYWQGIVNSIEDFQFNPNDMNDLSMLLQPIYLSPAINIPDIFSALDKIIREYHPGMITKARQSTDFSEMLALEVIRCQHPFPILERTVLTNVSSKPGSTGKTPLDDSDMEYRTIPKGSQVFIEFDQYAEKCAKREFSDFCPAKNWSTYVAFDDETGFGSSKWNKLRDSGTCPYLFFPFGAGSRRCLGYKWARKILKFQIQLIATVFHGEFESKLTKTESVGFEKDKEVRFHVSGCPLSWERLMQPWVGHRFSGRSNDSKEDQEDTFYILRNLLRVWGEFARERVFGYTKDKSRSSKNTRKTNVNGQAKPVTKNRGVVDTASGKGRRQADMNKELDIKSVKQTLIDTKLSSYLKSENLLAGYDMKGVKMTYRNGDFCDYIAMCSLAYAITRTIYGKGTLFTHAVELISVFMVVVFALRHGTALPKLGEIREKNGLLAGTVLYWSEGVWNLFKSRIDNCRMPWIRQAIVFALANIFLRQPEVAKSFVKVAIYLQPLSDLFPMDNWDHETMYTSKWWFMTYGLFNTSFVVTTILRTLSFFHHLWHNKLVFSFLDKTKWKNSLNFTATTHFTPPDYLNRLTGILHAYLTGIWTHIITVAPWFFTMGIWYQSVEIFHEEYIISLNTSYNNSTRTWVEHQNTDDHKVFLCHFLPMIAIVFYWVVLYWFVDLYNQKDMEDNYLNMWFIKDHYLGHKLTFDFNFLHGPHHDALPIGIIAVGDNGPLEGFLRYSVAGYLDSITNPFLSTFLFTKQIIRDIVGHQYVPGVFPYSSSVVEYGFHHAEHHLFSLYPLGFGKDTAREKIDIRSNKLEEMVFGYREQNPLWKWFQSEVSRIESFSEGRFIEGSTSFFRFWEEILNARKEGEAWKGICRDR